MNKFYTVTTKDGLVVKMEQCCQRPRPAFRLMERPAVTLPMRAQTIECTNCQTTLVELSWPNLPSLS